MLNLGHQSTISHFCQSDVLTLGEVTDSFTFASPPKNTSGTTSKTNNGHAAGMGIWPKTPPTPDVPNSAILPLRLKPTDAAQLSVVVMPMYLLPKTGIFHTAFRLRLASMVGSMLTS